MLIFIPRQNFSCWKIQEAQKLKLNLLFSMTKRAKKITFHTKIMTQKDKSHIVCIFIHFTHSTANQFSHQYEMESFVFSCVSKHDMLIYNIIHANFILLASII